MQREPFPVPGERLVDPPRRDTVHEGRSRSPISIVGGLGYGPAHPSWWAGHRDRGFSRLTIENDSILMKPGSLSRTIERRPIVRIPLNEITSASRTTWGLWFHVPGDPALDGTRFTPFWDRTRLKPLVELLQTREIPVDTMPVSTRVTKGFENGAVAMRPGLFLRDRGLLSWIEYILIAVVGLALMYFSGEFSHASAFFLAFFAFVVVLNVSVSIVGTWRRKKALAAYRESR